MEDEERAPVLAHERFLAARPALLGLDLADRFAEIERTGMWGATGSVSGLGSEWEATSTLRRDLPGLFARLGVGSVLDAPCGDARWMAPVASGLDYVGVDIVPALVDRNRAAAGDSAGRRFLVADVTSDPLPRADLVLCRDCLVHLSFARVDAAVANFRASGARWLLTTTFPLLRRNVDCEDGDWRALNLVLPPFSWPAPALLVDEGCEEAGGDWADKSLGLWELADLPPGRDGPA